MKIIYRHIFYQLSNRLFVIMSMVSVVFWLIPTLKLLNRFSDNQDAMIKITPYTVLSIPNVIINILPISLVIASALLLNKLSDENNLDVMETAGISRINLATPFILMAGFISILTMIMSFYISPILMHRLKDFQNELKSDILLSLFQAGKFNKLKEGAIFHVKNKHDNMLNGVFIKDRRDKKKIHTYSARIGSIVKTNSQVFLILHDGNIITENKGKNNTVDHLSFEYYTVNLSEIISNRGETHYKRYERTIDYLLNPDKNDEIFLYHPEKYYQEIHRRIMLSILPIVFCLIPIYAITKYSPKRRKKYLPNTIIAISTLMIWVILETVLKWSYPNNEYIYIYYLIPLSLSVFLISNILGFNLGINNMSSIIKKLHKCR